MSVEAIDGWSKRHMANRGFARSALMMVGWILAVAAALCVLTVATGQTGLNGAWGVAGAAAICLFSGLAAEAVGAVLHRAAAALAAMLIGMAIRTVPPLMVCLFLAVRGGGRELLPFILYLLTFYFVILTLDTLWAVQRAAHGSCASSRSL